MDCDKKKIIEIKVKDKIELYVNENLIKKYQILRFFFKFNFSCTPLMV